MKISRRIISLLLSLIIVLTTVFGGSGLSVFAVDTTPDLVTLNVKKTSDWVALKYIKSWTTFKAGNYKATINLKLFSGEMPRIKIGQEINADTASWMENYESSYNASKHLYTITFSLSSEWTGNLGWYVGNYGQITNCALANPTLYLLDSTGAETGNNLVNTFASDYYATSRSGNKWVKANCAGSLVTFSDIPTGYFDPDYDEGEYQNQGTEKTARFTVGSSSYLNYFNDNRFFKKGSTYELGFDCNLLSGSGLCVELYINGDMQTLEGNGYDPQIHKYIMNFTPLVSSASIMLKIGKSDSQTHLLVANPYIKEFDDDTGDLVDINLIHNIASNTIETIGDSAFSSENKLWNREGGYDTDNNQSVIFLNYDEDVFEGNNTLIRTTFENGDTNRYLEYRDYSGAGITNGATYKLVADYRRFSTNDVEVKILDSSFGDKLESNGVLTVDEQNKKLYYSFTANKNSDSLSVKIGNVSSAAYASIGRVNLYKTDSKGNITGESIVDECNALTLDTTSTNIRYDRVWATIGEANNDNYAHFSACEDSFFAPLTQNNKAVYFPAGKNNYQVMVYKDSEYYVTAGTYKLVFDQRTITGLPTIELRTGNDIGSNNSYTVVSDTTDVYKRTIIYSFSTKVKGIGVLFGNFGGGTNLAAVFANVEFYKIDSTSYSPISDNIFEPMATERIELMGGITRENAQNGYWSSLNFGSNNIVVVNPDDYFEETEPYVPSVDTNAKMLNISLNGSGTSYTPYLSTNLKLVANKTYIFEYDWKAYDGAVPFARIKYLSSSSNDYVEIAPVAVSGNTVDGTFTGTFTYDKSSYFNSGSYGHYKVKLTMPSDISSKQLTNLNFGFYMFVNDDTYNYARGAAYFSNVSVKQQGTDNNLISNGSFEDATEGDVDSNYPATGFEKGVADTLYETMRFVKQPQNFFTADGPTAEKALVLCGGNWDYVEQYFCLEPNTEYRLSYKSSYRNGPGSFFFYNYLSSNSSESVTKISSNFDYKTSTFTYVFRTSSDIRTVRENAVFRFCIPYYGTEVKFYIGDVKLYKLSGSATVGANLINNGGFTAGNPKTIKYISSVKSDDGVMNDVELTGWKLMGNYKYNNSISFCNIDDNTFPQILSMADRITNLINVILGKKASSNIFFEDVNHDDVINVLDLVKTKKDAIDLAGGNGEVDLLDNAFISKYVIGDNSTDFDKLRNFEDGSNMLCTDVTGTVYYVSSSTGNDNNNGTSPLTPWKTLSKANSVSASGSAVLFKCGDTWRRETPRKAALTTKGGVTYGAYGTGAKPIINGSLYNFAKNGYNGKTGSGIWTNVGTNIWKTEIKLSSKSVSTEDSVGHLVFDGVMGTMKKTKSELENEMDFFNQEYTGNDGGDGFVYVYSKTNPALKWNDIEIGQKSPVVVLDDDNITINNLCIIHGGEHGISGGGLSNIAISNCEVNMIGGSYNSGVRFGNGIQFGQGGDNLRVKNCYVTNVFDACLTFQSWATVVKNWYNVTFSNNLLTESFMGIEWFAQSDSTVQNIYLQNNIIRNMGGWCYNQRLGTPGQIGTLWCAGLKCGQDAYYKNVSNFNIKNNIFDRSNGVLVFWWFNANGVSDADRVEQPGLNISGNSFYQDDSDCRDGRLMSFDNQTAVSGTGTGALKVAVNTFDKNPNRVKFITHSERVIYEY